MPGAACAISRANSFSAFGLGVLYGDLHHHLARRRGCRARMRLAARTDMAISQVVEHQIIDVARSTSCATAVFVSPQKAGAHPTLPVLPFVVSSYIRQELLDPASTHS